MSITSALNTAMTGLTAASRATAVVSENLANSLTPGYAKRSLVLTSIAGASGVQVEGILRHVDPGIQASRRTAEAESGVAQIRADFYDRMTGNIGSVDDPFSITSRLSNFDGSLIEAISRPDSGPRLNDLSIQADALAQSISDAAEGLRSMRSAAERSIDVQVDQVNLALKDVQKLNARITVAQAGGMDAVALQDQRSQLIDQINQVIPVNVIQRGNGQVALFSQGGAILLDGTPAELSFDGKPDTMPHMTQANGLLSGLEINGYPLDTSATGPLRGGTLAAQFEIRDVLAVEAQSDLDAVARDLVERFQDPTLDATLGATDPGLFTDSGSFFDPTNAIGLANRLELNEKVALDGDAETWRLRDGLNAAVPGDAGEARLLQGYATALEEARAVSSAGMGSSTVTAATLGANLLSHFAQNNNAAEQALSFASASFNEMSQMELAQGVDTDVELQNLMLIEQAFAANARVMTVVDDLMKTLLRI